MIITKVKLGLLCFTVAIALLASGTLSASANESVNRATAALNSGNYKAVVKEVGKVVSGGNQKAEIIAKALLLRGIAYRKQGKLAQAIADLTNAEWVQKLKGNELRRLYAERALAYEAVGQKKLAAKDSALAGTKNFKSAKKSVSKNSINLINNNVRSTSVEASKSTTSELFGGLKGLFGFNNGPKPQGVVVKTKVKPSQLSVLKTDAPTLREIPTMDSVESKENAKKLLSADLPPVEKSVNAVPSNSAWAAQRASEMVVKKQIASAKINKNDGLITNSPVKLAPKITKTPESGNVFGNFINNVFGGNKKKADAPVNPVNPGDDIIVAEQVVSATPKKSQTWNKKVIKKKIRKALKKTRVAAVPTRTKVKKAAVSAKPQSRSLYHVQLGAFGESQAADRFVSRLNSKYKKLVGNKTAMVVETDLGQSRRQYRVFLGPYRSREKGKKTCNVLTRLGMGCTLVE